MSIDAQPFLSRSFRTLAEAGEHRFLEWVRARALELGPAGGVAPGGVALGIGDDAAVLSLSCAGTSADAIVTTDALIERVHFRHDWTSPRGLGSKALAVNLSDLAAMAALPVAAFLSLGAPPDARLADLEEFFEGFMEEGARHGCTLAGGDLVRAPVWMIAVTAIGRPAVAGRIATRAAARPGWNLYVTGDPGESAAGLEELRRGAANATGTAGVPGAPHVASMRDRTSPCIERHRRPTPRLAEAAALAAAFEELAMLDLSDGVFNDAGQMARASGTRVEIEFEALPVSEALRASVASGAAAAVIGSDEAGRGEGRGGEAQGVDPRELVLFGGEDYELLFATPHDSEAVARALAGARSALTVHRIGRIAAPGEGSPPGAVVIDERGAIVALPDRTFRHFG